uniref:Uncharacterized protein n=1 Tax=Oryza barthii TaxID=65489 RepID=A0A0D3GMT9_9ORYZ
MGKRRGVADGETTRRGRWRASRSGRAAVCSGTASTSPFSTSISSDSSPVRSGARRLPGEEQRVAANLPISSSSATAVWIPPLSYRICMAAVMVLLFSRGLAERVEEEEELKCSPVGTSRRDDGVAAFELDRS